MEETTETAVFDPKSVNLNDPGIEVRASLLDKNIDGDITYVVALWIDWQRDYRESRDSARNQQPEWYTTIPNWKDRIIMELPISTTRMIGNYVMGGRVTGVGPIGLPCPPYTFTHESGQLRIEKDGVFHEGTKADWQGVIEAMQAEVDEMPDGLTPSGELTVNVEARVIYQATVTVEDLLEGNDKWDGEFYTGDEDELRDDLEVALDYWEFDDYDIVSNEYELESLGDKTFLDLRYDLEV